MGAGKTSVGQKLAHDLQWRFIDLDDRVVAADGRNVPEIFRSDGEAAFRAKETAALRQLIPELASRPSIVALGGGAFTQPENVALIRATSYPVIFLDATIEELMNRCRPQSGQRPLFQNENQFRQLYERRRSAYMEADIRVDTGECDVSEVARKVASLLGLAVGDEQTNS
ncbi:MAG TPA: shikimate kinase [Terriglobales bacterium]|nr:shikimate kinase [Terriglobales bacterium]